MMTIDTYIIKSSKYHIVQTQENLNIPIKIHNNCFIWNKTNLKQKNMENAFCINLAIFPLVNIY
jgi:hypothetical protein